MKRKDIGLDETGHDDLVNKTLEMFLAGGLKQEEAKNLLDGIYSDKHKVTLPVRIASSPATWDAILRLTEMLLG